jgi:hypothetical protein
MDQNIKWQHPICPKCGRYLTLIKCLWTCILCKFCTKDLSGIKMGSNVIEDEKRK